MAVATARQEALQGRIDALNAQKERLSRSSRASTDVVVGILSGVDVRLKTAEEELQGVLRAEEEKKNRSFREEKEKKEEGEKEQQQCGSRASVEDMYVSGSSYAIPDPSPVTSFFFLTMLAFSLLF